MVFVGVEFEESVGGGVALVNSLWLTPRKREVFWPPFKQQHEYDKVLKKLEVPADLSSWQLYSVKRIFFECDDFVNAVKKLKQSELTSDVQTDVENEEPLRRKVRQPRRIFDESSDEDIECTEKKFKKTSSVARPARINFHRYNEAVSSLILNQSDESSTSQSACGATLPPFSQGNHTPSSQGQHTPSSQGHHTPSSRLFNISQATIHTSTPSTLVTDNLDQTLETPALKKIFSLLSTIKEQNSQILTWISKQSALTASEGILPDTLPVPLPLDSAVNLLSLEDYLKNSNNLAALSSYLSTLGGRELTFKTNRILKYLLKDQLAANYSFYGKRMNKKPFHDLLLCIAVVRAIKTNSSHTDKEIEDCMKIWLKHAPQRVKIAETKRAAALRE